MRRVEKLFGARLFDRGADKTRSGDDSGALLPGDGLAQPRVATLHGRTRARRSADCCAQRLIALVSLTAVGEFVLLFVPLAVFCQDNGSSEKELFGNGVAISVTVHDDSGSPISSPATVQLLLGSIPSGRAETSGGNATIIANSIGEFTVVVYAPGFREAQKELSVHGAGNAQVDVYLKRAGKADAAVGVPGRAILAPKAKEALDRGLLALSADKAGEAEKQIGQAMKLAPGHPDVLYAQGVLRIKQRNFAQAQSALEQATQVDPGHARAFAALGMALCDQGKYDAAIEPLEKSLQLDAAGTWETRWALAKAYYQHARYDEAVKMAQGAMAGSNGKEPEIALLVAQSLSAVGEYDDAARTLREFLRDHAERKEAATAQRWLERLIADGKVRAMKN